MLVPGLLTLENALEGLADSHPLLVQVALLLDNVLVAASLAGIVLATLYGHLLFVLFTQGEHLVRLAGYDIVATCIIHSLSDGLPRGQIAVNGAEEPVSKLDELAARVALGLQLLAILLLL